MALNLPQIADLLRPITNDQAKKQAPEPGEETAETPTSTPVGQKEEE